jgi:ABC-2 type transport system ATP-binding protein
MTWGARGIGVSYGPAPAVRGVTVEARPGAVTVVVGADGAGKTTLLRVLAGVLEPERGEVDRPPEERIGYMSAGPGVYPDLTVAENLAFVGRAYGMRSADVERRASALLAHTGLSGFEGRLGGRLSGGMRQKLALVAAMLHRPDLMVLDEPTTGVDPVSRSELWRLMSRAAADGAAVVLSTTYIDEAERAAHVVVLEEGRMLSSGTPDDILRSAPGSLYETDVRMNAVTSWRRAGRWLTWSPEGVVVPGGREVSPDLEDAVVMAALHSQRVSA